MNSYASKKTIRIVLVSEYFYPANNAPGARFKPLALEFIKHFALTIYTSKISAGVNEFSIKCNFLPFPRNQARTIARLFAEILYGFETFIRLIFSKGDIYYVTSPSFINCIFSVTHCLIFNKPYIIDIRDDYPRVYFEAGLIKSNSFAGRLLLKIEQKMCASSILVIAATEGIKQNIKKYYSGNIWLLRNGYSNQLFKPCKEKYPDFTLVFHGIISNYQDVDLLIDLGKAITKRNLEISIIVIGQGSQEDKLKNNLPPCIKYLGPKPYEDIPTLISKAHLGLSFRRQGKISQDSFPVKTYEYIGVGIPIIVTPISEAGNYVTKSKIGYQFNPENIDELLNKIIEIKSDAELYSQLTENILKIRPQFSRERISEDATQQIIDLIQKGKSITS